MFQFPNNWSNVFLASSALWFVPPLPPQSRNAKSKYSQKSDRFFPSPARLAALVRHAAVVENAIEADAQVIVAAVAALTAAGPPVEFPFRAAVVTMPVHRWQLFAGRLAKRLAGPGMGIRRLAKRLADLFGGAGPSEAVFVTQISDR